MMTLGSWALQQVGRCRSPLAGRVEAGGKPLLDPEGRVQLVDPSGERSTALAPIGRDWRSSNVTDPKRLRILFRTTVQ